MAVLEMRKICICALKKERKAILEYLQQSGVVEIQEKKVKKGFTKIETDVAKSRFDRNAAIAENSLEILDKYISEKKSMFSSLEGKKLVDSNIFDEISKKQDVIMEKANRIINLQKDIAAKESDILKTNAKLEAIEPWLNMDVPAMTTGTLRTSFIYGSLPGNLTQEQLYKNIEESGKFPKASDVRIIHSDKNQTCIAGFCMKKDLDQFENALREIDFSRPSFIIRSEPAVSKEKRLRKIERLREEIDSCISEIKELGSCREDIKAVADYFRSRAEKAYVFNNRIYSKKERRKIKE